MKEIFAKGGHISTKWAMSLVFQPQFDRFSQLLQVENDFYIFTTPRKLTYVLKSCTDDAMLMLIGNNNTRLNKTESDLTSEVTLSTAGLRSMGSGDMI